MISIILVHYHVKKEILSCIKSIYASKPKTAFEIIVVDNDEKKTIETELKKLFPNVRYVKNENKGFGQGNNVGISYTKGEYLFFLNPDTKLLNNTLDEIVSFFNKHKNAGIVAPAIFDSNNDIFPLQGTKELTPIRAIFSLSFISKLFPKNKIRQDYYLSDWDKKYVKEVDVVPGTAFMIRKELFEKVGGFDDHFFLFFEEFDLCKRIKGLGWKIFMNPNAQIFHAWGQSTQKSKKDIAQIFQKSRFYYLKKHFGWPKALVTDAILHINKFSIFLFILLLVGAYLRLHNIQNSMTFIGDQGWFYLSARDMLLSGQIPLVGITSSHPWLHQGAFWIYLLAPVLWFFHFNPFGGIYLSTVIGLLSILGIYKLGAEMFSKSTGIIAAALFTTSPLIILTDRTAYHTTPIMLCTILVLYCLYKWMKGNAQYAPFLVLFLAVLYNLELATSLLSVTVFVIWFFGFITKKAWARKILNRKILLFSFILFILPMLPMFFYDITHGFPQTVKLFAWVGYRILVYFGYPASKLIESVSLSQMVHFFVESCRQLIFSSNAFVAIAIFIASLFFAISRIFKNESKKPYGLLILINLFLVTGLFIIKTPSGAYLPMIFPSVILLISILFEKLIIDTIKIIKLIGIVGLICLTVFNTYSFLRTNSNDFVFAQRVAVAKYIVKASAKKEYNLKGRGPASEFESFTMNYEYLTWWLGHGPSKSNQALQFVVEEKPSGIFVTKEEKKSL